MQSSPNIRPTVRRIDPFLGALLVVFALFAVTYSLVLPLFEGPDEDDHFRFTRYLAQQRALPVQLFQAGGGEAGHQGWQPPLYYALAALVVAPVDTSDFERRLQRNPAQSFVGDIACCGRNLYFHLDAENFPYRNTALAVHLARGVTILFGLVTVYAIYALTLALFPGRNSLALATTAVAVLNPTFLFASALVSNDIPLVAFCTLALLVMAKLLTGAWQANWKSFLWLGVFIAGGLLVKTTALGLAPLVVVTVGWVAYQARAWRLAMIGLVGAGAPPVLLAGWWFVRNQISYGDPLAYRLIAASALPPRDAPLTVRELLQINLPWLWQTFWGGPTPGDFPQAFLYFFLAMSVIAVMGILLFLAHAKKSLAPPFAGRLLALGLLGAWLGFIFVAQLQFIRTASGTDQGRYLFPAIAAFALILVLGWSELAAAAARLFTRRFDAEHAVSVTITGFFVALPAFVLIVFTLPAFARPTPFNPAALESRGAKLAADFENGMQLRGVSLGSRAVSCGEKLAVTLFWTSDARIKRTYRVFAHLVNEQGVVAGNKDVIPGRGAFPTLYWKPGEWLEDTIYVPLNQGARAGIYQVIVGTYPFGKPDERVNLRNSDADFVTVGDVQVNAPAEGCP